ncbi:mannosyltransferase [Neorhodopirellula lusitana]|uniref:Mannosyltransferase n=1 Tax=Neorhodopirellula lusitana TaxID=445327 RepID=A0ABY1PUM3_9BACT|nr:glycosyltransferase family 4 protein [Neorhodopirellula lusitana]SMP47795.1 mannosyltransferase [Neorhodopirellula lusitana]
MDPLLRQKSLRIDDATPAQVMAPSLGMRFSGINATMEALLPTMAKSIRIACCGRNLSDRMPQATLKSWLTASNRKQWRVWHARRNNDMIIGLLLRHVLRQKLALLFTSAAQREHTWLTKFCYHRMDSVIATTQIAADFLDCESTVSHHGVDTSQFKPTTNQQQVRRQLGIADRPTLSVFGRIRPQKGTGDLVEALLATMGDFPDWQVVFVGAITEKYVGYQRKLVQDLTDAGLADRVTFQGFLKDFNTLPLWYQAADVVGCVSRNEGFGVTCLEAMASGVPVMATHAGAWADILTDNEDGWLAQASDPTDLARAVRIVFSTSHQQRSRMGQNALKTIRDQYTIHHESDRIIAVYQSLLAKYGESLQRRPDEESTALHAA